MTEQQNNLKNEIERISEEEYSELQSAKQNAAFVKISLEKAEADNAVANLQIRNLLLQAYIKYGMTSQDHIQSDGTIIRAKVANKEE